MMKENIKENAKENAKEKIKEKVKEDHQNKPGTTDVKRCRKCLISEKVPGTRFHDDGTCYLCAAFEKKGDDNNVIAHNRDKIKKILEERKGIGRYDVIVAYSGGKDSSYTTYLLKEHYKLNVLALLIDNDFVAEGARRNAETFTGKLGVDLVVFKPVPGFMHNLYNQSLEGDIYSKTHLIRANAACLSCINLINNLTLNEAIIRKIPVIAGGYIGGQVPVEAGSISLDNKFLKDFRKKNMEFLAEKIDPKIKGYLQIAEPAEGQFFPVAINPLLGLDYRESDIIATISQYGWKAPVDTGKSSSNCLLNDYAIAVHYERYGYHSYESEICMQVRRGTLTKEEAMEKLEDIKPSESFTQVLDKLGKGNADIIK